MNDTQKASILGMYNAALRDQLRAEAGMDSVQNDKAWSRCANEHSFALGKQSAIDAMLEALGYTLILDDEDKAIDIQP